MLRSGITRSPLSSELAPFWTSACRALSSASGSSGANIRGSTAEPSASSSSSSSVPVQQQHAAAAGDSSLRTTIQRFHGDAAGLAPTMTSLQPDASRSAYVESRQRSAAVDSSAAWAGLKVPLEAGLAPHKSPLSKPQARIVQRLVGCLTKQGKKATAQRIVLDALEIIRSELAKTRQQAEQAQGSTAPAADGGRKASSGKKAATA